MTNKILIQNCNIVKDASTLLRDGYIAIENSTIRATGPMTALKEKKADLFIDGHGKLAIPGLINAHNHSPMTLFRGMADDLELGDWLHNHIFPAEAAHVTEEMVYWCSKLAAAEMLLSGTTCVADGYFYSDQTAKAFEEAGLRAVVAHGIVDFPAPGVPDPSKNIEVVDRFIDRWKDASELIEPAVFAHSAYTCSPSTLRQAKKLADKYDVRFFIHLAETGQEKDMIIEPSASTPLLHLHKLGILDDNCVLVHAVWLTDEDIEVLSSSGAHVVLCPQSNFKLASGKSRAAEMLKRGLELGLGTDGCASNNSMDMFAEMSLLAKSQKVFHSNPTIFPAEYVFNIATRNNNSILGLPSPATIQQGSRADITLIDTHQPHLTPLYNQDLLIYAVRGSDVDTVIINGRVIINKGQITTFDLTETKHHIHRLADPLLRQMKIKG